MAGYPATPAGWIRPGWRDTTKDIGTVGVMTRRSARFPAAAFSGRVRAGVARSGECAMFEEIARTPVAPDDPLARSDQALPADFFTRTLAGMSETDLLDYAALGQTAVALLSDSIARLRADSALSDAGIPLQRLNDLRRFLRYVTPAPLKFADAAGSGDSLMSDTGDQPDLVDPQLLLLVVSDPGFKGQHLFPVRKKTAEGGMVLWDRYQIKALIDLLALWGRALRRKVRQAQRQNLPPAGSAKQPAAPGPDAGDAATAPRPDGPEDLPALLSAADLSDRLQQPRSRVESFLRRFRKSHRDCYTEADSPRRNEPRYLYRVADVWPALTAKRRTSDGRKKNS